MRESEPEFRAACEGTVLLKNDGILPMSPGRVSLYGAGAVMTIAGGWGSGEVNNLHSVNIREGLLNYGFEIDTDAWLDRYRRIYDEELKKHIKSFKLSDIANIMSKTFKHPSDPVIQDSELGDSDTCIYVIARQSGEAKDRRQQDISVSEGELINLQKCAANYRNIILILNVAGFFDLSFADNIPQIKAVISMCGLGEEGGNAIACVFSGRENPSGRLAATWPMDCGGTLFERGEQSFYAEGIYVGYRYYDAFSVKARFPFGYGLSYTEFETTAAALTQNADRISLNVCVKNTGKYSGANSVLLYAMCPKGDTDKEPKRLVAFNKTRVLLPGESECLKLSFELDLLAGYSESSAEWILDAGEYVLATDRPVAAVIVPKDYVISRHLNICPVVQGFEEIRPAAHKAADAKGLMSITAEYPYAPMDYRKVTDKARVADCVVGEGYLDLFAKNNIPGAAGRAVMGGQTVWMADGPAGLRVARVSVRNRRGHEAMVTPHMKVFGYIPPIFRPLFFGRKSRGKLIERNATAFPVSMAMAQSFNTELIERCAAKVAGQMADWGIRYWLAPGLNIQRDYLCGRNFEYFSEDPVVSGLMAAAVVRGCQSVGENCATLKHFCCNNQEDYRNTMSANVHERALREIYLRGFQIALRHSSPRAVMTSYNKVNGTYVTESSDLINTVLRNEWGFDGTVMTDWYATSRGHADVRAAALAGTDVFMPGSARDRRILKRTRF